MTASRSQFGSFAGDFEMLASVLAALSIRTPTRTTLRQALFLMVVAYCHAMGRSITLADAVEIIGDSEEVDPVSGKKVPIMGRAIEKSAWVFMEPTRAYPDALSWVEQVADKDDRRKKYLRLTPAGQDALSTVIASLIA